MTIKELEQWVLRLSNTGWCRYWLMYNYPICTELAIQVIDSFGVPQAIAKFYERDDLVRMDRHEVYVFRKDLDEQLQRL